MRWYVIRVFGRFWYAASYENDSVSVSDRFFHTWREAYDYADAQTGGNFRAYSQH